MSHIYCLGDPLPEIPDLANIKIPFGFAFPGLPTLPTPIFPTLIIPSLEKYIAGVELQFSQLIMTVKSFIDPLLNFLNIPLIDWLPAIPTLPTFNILDIINGRVDKIIAEIRRLVKLNFDFKIPMLPTLYPTLEIPDIKVIHTFQIMMRNYLAIVVTKVTDLISQVTSILNIGMPPFPVIPTEDQIIQMIREKIDSAIENIDDFVIYVKNFKLDINLILSKIVFPMLPALPKIPNIMIDIKIPEVEIVAEISNFMMNLVYGLMKKIKDFIDQTLGQFINFSFPTICI